MILFSVLRLYCTISTSLGNIIPNIYMNQVNNHDAILVQMSGTYFTAGWMCDPCQSVKSGTCTGNFKFIMLYQLTYLGATIWVPLSGCHYLGATIWVPLSGCHYMGATIWVPLSGCHCLGATVWVPLSGATIWCHCLGATIWVPLSGCHYLGVTIWVPLSGCHYLGATIWVPLSGCHCPGATIWVLWSYHVYIITHVLNYCILYAKYYTYI